MMNDKMTPGPWQIKSTNDWIVEDLDYNEVADCDSSLDARAIAALPELVEACQFLLAHDDSQGAITMGLHKIEQALRKAGIT